MKLLVTLLLPLLASAAILPETMGGYHRTSTAQPALSDRPVWDEYGLKASENAVFEHEKDKFTATIWRLQDPTGALAAFDWQRPADSAASPAAKPGAETTNRL